MTGALFGLGAAVTLGINQILMTFAARRWGTVRATLASVAVAFLLLITFAVVIGADVPFRGNDLIPLLAGLGAAVGFTYLAQLKSLREGPLSVVAPIGATGGAMIVLSAFMLLGERPSAFQWVGIPVAALGAVAVSVESASNRKVRLIGKGPVFAALAVLAGSVSGAMVRIPVRELGPMATILLLRGSTVAMIAMVFTGAVVMGRSAAVYEGSAGQPGSRAAPTRAGPLSSLALLLLIGVLDAAAFIFFAEGLLRSDAWLVGLVSQSGRVIAVAGGFLLFQERLRSHQWTGVALVAAGLLLAVFG